MLRAIIKNAGWLGLVQILNFGLPIITLPVVTRAFGPGLYGLIATIFAYSGYVALIINYGFNYAGPRKVALLRSQPDSLSRQVSTIVFVQLLLAALSSLAFIGCMLLAQVQEQTLLIGLLILTQTVTSALSFQWVFIGLERLREFSILQLVTRAGAALAVISTVRTPDDVLIYAAINAAAATVGTIGVYFLLRGSGLVLQRTTRGEMLAALREALGLFSSTVSINLYTASNILIIGLVLGVGAVGPFALADRLKQAIGGVLGPLTNAVYPLVCRISGRDASKEETRAKQLFFCLIVAVSGTASLGLLIFAPLIVSIVGGKAFEETTTLLRIIAPVPLIVALSNILGVQTMMPLRMDRQVAIIVTTAAIFGSAGMFISTYYFHLSGAAATVLLVEAFVTTAMAVALLRQRVSIIKLFWG